MLVNITKAAKLAGISRDTFYKNYINKGKVSTTKDYKDRPMVDTSEILRVFGCLKGESPTYNEIQGITLENTPLTPSAPPDLVARVATLEAENRQLLERLEEAKDREQWQRGQIERLTDTIKLLEAPKKTTTVRGWLERLMGR